MSLKVTLDEWPETVGIAASGRIKNDLLSQITTLRGFPAVIPGEKTSPERFETTRDIMAYATEEILRGLKEAREAKGLGQRDLGARIGMLQSHISKIESGRSDIRLSSQIGFARALDLDLRFVPRAAVPVLEGVVRSTIPPPPLPDSSMRQWLFAASIGSSTLRTEPRPCSRTLSH